MTVYLNIGSDTIYVSENYSDNTIYTCRYKSAILM